MKTCIKCNLNLSEENYSKSKNICKKCSSISFKEWREKDKLAAPSKILPDKKVCTVCKIEFPISEFYIRRDRNKPISRCKKCGYIASKKSYAKLTDAEKQEKVKRTVEWTNKQAKNGNLRVIFTKKIDTVRSRSKKYNVPFDITIDYIIDLYKSQNGKCYYTGKDLTTVSFRGEGHQIVKFDKYHYQASLDRLVPEKGYVKGNVVWCGWLVNTCKNLLTEEQFYEFCNTVINKKLQKQNEVFEPMDG